jgi:hypothetical protein
MKSLGVYKSETVFMKSLGVYKSETVFMKRGF